MSDQPPLSITPFLKISTGVSGLDKVLGGGFLQGGTYLLTGSPGVGKTIVANQICYHHVATRGPAVYITLLSSEHARLLNYLQSFSFFDPAAVGVKLHYLNAYGILEESGLAGLLSLFQRTVREYGATLLIIDTLIAAEAFSENELAFQKFISDLQVSTAMYGCTTILVNVKTHEQPGPLEALADGILDLRYLHADRRTVRELEVIKFRGGRSIKGSHFCDIDRTGFLVYPRLEASVTFPDDALRDPPALLASGLPDLDTMLGGGLFSGSITMLLGTPGSGKTPLGASFLTYGAENGESGLHFGFYEMPGRLLYKTDRIGVNFRQHVEEGTIGIVWQPPIERNLDMLATHLLDYVHQHKVRRLFLDGLDGFQQAALFTNRLGPFLTALCNQLRILDVTTIFTVELNHFFGLQAEVPFGGISAVVDNIILLRSIEQKLKAHRLISILKSRGLIHDASVREFTVTDHGIEIALSPLGPEVMAHDENTELLDD